MTLGPIDILLIEDNASDAELTVHALQKYSRAKRIHIVLDGAEALEFFTAPAPMPIGMRTCSRNSFSWTSNSTGTSLAPDSLQRHRPPCSRCHLDLLTRSTRHLPVLPVGNQQLYCQTGQL